MDKLTSFVENIIHPHPQQQQQQDTTMQSDRGSVTGGGESEIQRRTLATSPQQQQGGVGEPSSTTSTTETSTVPERRSPIKEQLKEQITQTQVEERGLEREQKEKVRTESGREPVGVREREKSLHTAAGEQPSHEQERELGVIKGQVPWKEHDEVLLAREIRDKEKAAAESGQPALGERMKLVEYTHTGPLKHPTGVEKPTAGSWFSGAVSSGPSTTSTSVYSPYPMCLRSIVTRRRDLQDSDIEGDVIFVQEGSNKPTQVIGSVRGINPGLHGMAVLEFGDLELGRAGAGLHFDGLGSKSTHGGANTKIRHRGDLGNILADRDGVAFFNFVVQDLPLIDIAGRSLAVYSGEDDCGRTFCACKGSCGDKRSDISESSRRCGDRCRLGPAGNCYSCLSEIQGNSGHVLGLGLIVHADLVAMERLKNVALGVGKGAVTHEEIMGRPMHERLRQHTSESEYPIYPSSVDLDRKRREQISYEERESRPMGGGVGGYSTYGGSKRDETTGLEASSLRRGRESERHEPSVLEKMKGLFMGPERSERKEESGWKRQPQYEAGYAPKSYSYPESYDEPKERGMYGREYGSRERESYERPETQHIRRTPDQPIQGSELHGWRSGRQTQWGERQRY